MYNLIEYYPKFYKGVLEFEQLLKGQETALSLVNQSLTKFVNNQYIVTSDEDGVSQREGMLEIVADPSVESLTFRKQRLMNRLQSRPPYTENFFRQRLDTIIGQGMYNLDVNDQQFVITLESSATSQQWLHEIYITMSRMKPANMVFRNIPLLTDTIHANELISYGEYLMNYKLGTSFILGQRPFGQHVDRGVVKMPNTSSIKQQTFGVLAAALTSEISKVQINNGPIITAVTKSQSGGRLELYYTIATSLGITEVTNLKLLNSSDEVLSEAAVYIPVINDLEMKHILNVKEGV